ncbi:MAG: hypothetical protein HS115_12840 [Spirochaetales bacterium]|nr:hypothetical protein [Spirochaetales bacterium]
MKFQNPQKTHWLCCLSLVVLTLQGGCSSSRTRVETARYKEYPLAELGVRLSIPDFWEVSANQNFQLVARGPGPSGLLTTIEYRGLEKSPKDATDKALYATGWYDAIAANYRDWSFISRKRSSLDPEGRFELEGTYREGAIVFRKLGILRFRNHRIHAIYYTAPDQNIEPVRQLFLEIDRRHIFEDP